MLPNDDKYDLCHGCGVRFRIETWASWNTIGGTLYSDGYFVAPFSPKDDVYFKCPKCGVFIDKWSWMPKDLEVPEYQAPGLVDLELATFSEAYDAVKQKARDGVGLTQLIYLRYQLWILGNHIRRDENRDLPLSPYEIENLELLLVMVTPAPEHQLLRAIVLRALGRFAECKTLLNPYECENEGEFEIKKLNYQLLVLGDFRVGKWDTSD